MSSVRMKIVSIILSCLLLPLFAMAEPTYDEQGDLIRPNSERYAGVLDDIGPANRGVVSLIVINDTRYQVDEDTVYRNIRGNLSSLASFSRGMQVEYYALENLVTKLRVLSLAVGGDGERREEPPVQSPGTEDVRLEDGVWKN